MELQSSFEEANATKKSDLIDQLYHRITYLTEQTHHDGLTYWDIFKIIREVETDLLMKSEAGNHLKESSKPSNP